MDCCAWEICCACRFGAAIKCSLLQVMFVLVSAAGIFCAFPFLLHVQII